MRTGQRDRPRLERLCGALQHVLCRSVVLDEVEVGGGEVPQRAAQSAHRRSRLQENFRQDDGRAHVQIDTAFVHSFDQRAEQAEVAVRGGAQRSAVGAGVDVEDVRAQRQVHQEGNLSFVGLGQQTYACKLGFACAAGRARGQVAPHGFAQADLLALGVARQFVEQRAGLLRHAEASLGELCFYVLGGAARERDFKIMNQRCAGGGDALHVAALHQVDQHRRQPHFDHMAAQAPQDGLLLAPGLRQRVHQPAELRSRQDVGQRLEKVGELRPALVRPGKILGTDLRRALAERLRPQPLKLHRLEVVDRFHSDSFNLILTIISPEGVPDCRRQASHPLSGATILEGGPPELVPRFSHRSPPNSTTDSLPHSQSASRLSDSCECSQSFV